MSHFGLTNPEQILFQSVNKTEKRKKESHFTVDCGSAEYEASRDDL